MRYPDIDAIVTTGGAAGTSALISIDGRKRVLSLGNDIGGCSAYVSGTWRFLYRGSWLVDSLTVRLTLRQVVWTTSCSI